MVHWILLPVLLLCFQCYAVQSADESFNAAVKAPNAVERQDEFNKALGEYLSLERFYRPTMGNGVLYYNIGSTYYQLESYPWALLYAYKALQLDPDNPAIQDLIKASQEKLGIETNRKPSPFKQLFFFHTSFSIPQKLQVLAGCSMIVFLLVSLAIWVRWIVLRALACLSIICWGVVGISLFTSYYLSPIEAVVVQSTFMFRDAGKQFVHVNDQPIPSGAKVEVLDIMPDGLWMKVSESNGNVGFVPYESIRII